MFVGAMPEAGLIQMARAVDFNEWPAVYVCCSGIFRVERTIRKVCQTIDIHSNDVSLLTTMIGHLACGKDMPVTFKDKLEWIGQSLGEEAGLREKLAGLIIANAYAGFATGNPNRYKERHAREVQRGFQRSFEQALAKVDALVDSISIQSYFAGDLREHVKRAIERNDGAGVVGFPPTYKGGYEQIYKFLNQNIDWPSPEYGIWDPPTDLPKLMDDLDAAGVPWYIGGDFVIEGREPVAELKPGHGRTSMESHTIYGYASKARGSSFHVHRQKSEPFTYTPLDPAKLTEESVVEFVPNSQNRAGFLKDVYLSKNIDHKPGEANFLVYVDGMLAGQVVYSLSIRRSYDPDEIYLISDLSTTRDAKVSKLIAALSTSSEVIAFLERHFMRRFTYVVTTAFAKGPVSMKYRGVFDLLKRAEHPDGFMLNYGRRVGGQSAAAIFNEWWSKHGRREVEALRAKAQD